MRRIVFLGLFALYSISVSAVLADNDTHTLTLRDHKFEPAELRVPADRKLKLVVVNTDPTPEEFESHDLNREKVVTGKGTITMFVGPLKPGAYSFFGEFNKETAKGTLIAEAGPVTK